MMSNRSLKNLALGKSLAPTEGRAHTRTLKLDGLLFSLLGCGPDMQIRRQGPEQGCKLFG
jgi:hypothetical protein